MHTTSRILPALLISLLVLSLGACGKSPEEHLQNGKSWVEKGNYRAAVLELKTTLQKQPGNKDARLLLGQAYLSTGAYAEAEKELRKALEFGASNEQVLPGLARTLLLTGKAQQVIDLVIPASGVSGTALSDLQAARAEAFLSLKKPEDAQQAIAAAEQADAKQPNLLLLKARLAASKQDLGTAQTLINTALSSNDKFIDGYYFLAALHEANKKPEEAIKAYEKVVSLDSKAYRAHLAISDIHLKQGKKEAGEKALKAAEAAAPNMPIVKFARGVFELRNNNLKAANDALLEVLKVAPDYLPAQLASAMVNLGLGNYEQSLKSAQLVVAKHPANSLAVRVMAASQLKSGDAKSALATLTPQLKARPDDAALLALAGEAYFQNKNYAQALNSIKQAEALSPGNAELKGREAASLMALGQTDQALSALEAAAKLSDKVGRADTAIISVHLQRKDFDAALTAIAALEKKLPNNAITHNLRAAALIGKDDKSGARQSLEKAVAIDAKFFPAVANLARMDIMEKHPEAAKKRFEALLALDDKNLQAMLAMAEMAKLNKQEKDYVAWLEKAAKAHPEAIQPKALLARHQLSAKEPGKAIETARELVKNNPEDLQALNLLGTTQLAGKDPKAALETYKQLALKAPNSPDAHLRVAIAQLAVQNNVEGRASLNKALQLKPDFEPAMDAFLRLELSEKKPEAALPWAKKIQDAQPKSPKGFDREGDIQMIQQRFAPAASAYQLAINKGAGTQVLLKLHAALKRAGDSKAAQAKLDNWVNTHPADLAARAFSASQAMQSGQSKLAITQYEEILRQRPKEVMALNNLANLYHTTKDPRALKMAEQAYQALPQNPAIQDTLGWILLEQGNTAKGLDLLKKSAGQDTKNATIQYHYAVALARSGDKANAKGVLQKALSNDANFPEAAAAKALLQGL